MTFLDMIFKFSLKNRLHIIICKMIFHLMSFHEKKILKILERIMLSSLDLKFLFKSAKTAHHSEIFNRVFTVLIF